MSDPSEAIGRRIGAALIDLLLMFVLFVALGLALGEGESGDGEAGITLEGAEALLYFVLVLAYYIATELAMGATVGKRLLGLVVVGADGTRAGAGPVVIRNLLRIVDGLPFLYLVGLVTMLLTARKQRVGDLAAGTFVTLAGQPPAGTAPPPGYGAPPPGAPPPPPPPGAPPPPPA